MEFLKVENLYKNFNNVRAVDGISFEVRGGEIFGLLGPNGAGKSTAISMISTLFHPTGGDILFKGKSIIKEPGALRRKLDKVNNELLESVKKIKGIRNAEIVDGNVVVSGENVDLAFADIISRVNETGRRIISIDVNRPDLEAVFLHLTGRALRD
ncbi:MAG: ATP-binding cassette domain-containing protein [Caulobacteraceae bacterium]